MKNSIHIEFRMYEMKFFKGRMDMTPEVCLTNVMTEKVLSQVRISDWM